MGRDRLCLVGDLFRAVAPLFLSTVVVLSVGGCKPSEESKNMNTKFQLPTIDQWSSAAKARVLFGHQSVGYNILDGVNTLAKEQGVTDFKIADISVAKDSGAAAIVHFEVGRNTDPRSKTDDFLGRVDATSGRRIDVAMMKFCYVDVSDDTRIDTLFKEYKEMVARVRSMNPNMTIAHITMPLVARQEGFVVWLKTIAKRVLGRPIRRVELNLKRAEFNSLLKAEYENKDPIFDLATIESTTPEGQRTLESEAGVSFPVLFNGYSEDGGHLNAYGQRVVAAEFIRFLAKVHEGHREPAAAGIR